VPALGAVAAAAACAAIGLGVWAATLKGDLDFERRAAALLADPTARTIALQAGDGKLVVNGDGRAVLVLDGVEPAPSGKTYAVWIVEGETPRPAGLFDGSEGRDVVLVDGTVPAGALVAVSVERDGGADAPTTTPFVASDRVS
jgi:anti-sigma-K factor RskA